MRELTFDDAFWRDVLAALREPGGVAAERLEERRPGFAELVERLARDARAERCLIGGRPSTAGKNPRLFLFLTAALLARRGVETLYLDLGSELRWLEMLLGEDLKEGLVDHLQYDVTIERCTHPTAIDGLDVLTGGAYFLAGSPLEDAPAFRAALEKLRERYDAVVVAFPHPFDAAEAAGMPALCEAWIAIEEGEVEAPVTGNERAVVRLVGDPQAAWDLARLCRAFLGPLPTVVAGGTGGETPTGSLDPGDPGREERDEPGRKSGRAREEPVEDEEEVAFLRAFEGVVPPAAGRDRPGPVGRKTARSDPDGDPAATVGGDADVEAGRGFPAAAAAGAGTDVDTDADSGIWDDFRGSSPRREKPRREKPAHESVPPAGEPGGGGRWGAVAAVGALVVVAVLAVVFLTDRFEPLFAGSDEDPEWALEWDGEGAEEGNGTVVALDAADDPILLDGEADDEPTTTDEEDAVVPAAIEGEPAPYSLHVGSYQSPESGARVVERLEEAGQTGFLAPVDLGERGRWHRVYAGAFADSSSAAAALERILDDGIVEEGAVRRTPWSFRVAVHPTRDEAERALDELAIPAYVAGDGPSVIWAGAFRSREEAATMAAELEAAGVPAELTTRERPR